MGTVYLPNETMRRNKSTLVLEPVLDLSDAERYGTIETVLPHLPLSELTGAYLLELVCRKIRTFTDDDYVLAAGDPAMMAAVLMVACERNGGRVNLLRWDRKLRAYTAISLDLNERNENGKSIFQESATAV